MTWGKGNPPKKPALLDFSQGSENSKGVCWVCGSTPGEGKLDCHHMVPRALGGEEGPTVWLCQPCHRRVHEAGYGRGVEPSGCALSDSRCSILGGTIMEAARVVKDDPNKSVVFTDRFPAETRKQLRELAKATGKTQKEVVRMALAYMHRTLYGKR